MPADQQHLGGWPEPEPGAQVFKYFGGKRLMLEHLLPRFPAKIERYHELMLGGGSVFFALAPRIKVARLYDGDALLIDVWRQIVRRPEQVAADLDHLVNRLQPEGEQAAADFARQQAACFTAWGRLDSAVQAARYIYFKSVHFRGALVWSDAHWASDKTLRVRSQGPMSRALCAKKCAAIRASARAFQDTQAQLHIQLLERPGCEVQPRLAGPGDVIYLDPPYYGSNTALYQEPGIFAEPGGHEYLARLAKNWARQGARVIISYGDCPEVRELYAGAEMHTAQVSGVKAGQQLIHGNSLRDELVIVL